MVYIFAMAAYKSTIIDQQPQAVRELKHVKPEDRITSDFASQFEVCNVICIRAKHIELGGPIFTDSDIAAFRGGIPAENIARQEIAEKKCPLAIIRQFPGTDIAEYWDFNELSIKDIM